MKKIIKKKYEKPPKWTQANLLNMWSGWWDLDHSIEKKIEKQNYKAYFQLASWSTLLRMRNFSKFIFIMTFPTPNTLIYFIHFFVSKKHHILNLYISCGINVYSPLSRLLIMLTLETIICTLIFEILLIRWSTFIIFA